MEMIMNKWRYYISMEHMTTVAIIVDLPFCKNSKSKSRVRNLYSKSDSVNSKTLALT